MISELDREALQRSLDLTLAEKDRGRVEQVRSMLSEDGWESAARFCSFHRQIDHLSLFPWQDPPCTIDPDEIETLIAQGSEAAKLLRKMISAGLSPYDPTPIDSLAAKQRG